MSLRFAVLLLCTVLMACANRHTEAAVGDLDATTTFSGTIPCADCAGQKITLTLYPDATFRMRTIYLDVPERNEVYLLGRWERMQNEPEHLILRAGSAAPVQFRLQTSGALLMLDTRGQVIATTLNYELAREREIDAVAGPMALRGMYIYQANAASLSASLRECRTDKRLPVLIEGDQLALDRAYLAAQRTPGESMLAGVTARIRFESLYLN